MSKIKKKLPPLSLLKVFEVAGRFGNFTHTGVELGTTQAAVSQQIRRLESILGVDLFERRHRDVLLTSAGERLFKVVSPAIEQMADACTELRRGNRSSNLTLASDLAFSHQWLMNHLTDFISQNSNVTPSIIASDYEADCLKPEIDVAILYGEGQWPGFDAIKVFDEEVFPVCSPEYIKENGPVTAENIYQHTLLDLRGRWDWMNWGQWLTTCQLNRDKPSTVREFNNLPLMTESAVAGQGVALGWKYLCDSLVESGKLVVPFSTSVTTSRGYFLVTRIGLSEAAIDFCKWLSEKADST